MGKNGKKQGVSGFFCGSSSFLSGKAPFRPTLLMNWLKPLWHYLKRQENEITAERNPKQWKARSMERQRRMKCRFLFVSKLSSTRSSWKGSFLTTVSHGFRSCLSAPCSIGARVIKYYKKPLQLSFLCIDFAVSFFTLATAVKGAG
jgi:hypothetical protein